MRQSFTLQQIIAQSVSGSLSPPLPLFDQMTQIALIAMQQQQQWVAGSES